ncbi:ankyrin repeat-containing protein [Fusarium beomiforme]|uniref:Ankyrin repeat-containing protein n=1 Tax=Fusarium beomiforme TaxID=44412 RepID=A0A9P5A5Q6_9HYPO|nr:ankyrin repeat-containing protein [Fusarium beomiforme]
MAELDPSLYDAVWIAPMEIEAQAALHMLDSKHRGKFRVGRGDDYIFYAGTMSGHNIIIATLPAGQPYGTGSAAALASQVKKSFPNLWFGLLVGVAAGLPNLLRDPVRDIRLGDVLVALPDGESAGLVAYDLGKIRGDQTFQPLRLGHALATTEAIIRSAIGRIKIRAPNDVECILPHYHKIKNMQHATGNFRDPGQHKDIFYEVSSYGLQKEIQRAERPQDRRTRIWYGPIGSGDKLMRNAYRRNELRDKYNIIGLEMEAAGTMNQIPVGVIRGVCGYGDEHKSKEWQPYAAAMAAAYGKALLSEILTDKSQERWQALVTESQNETDGRKRSYDRYLESCPEEDKDQERTSDSQDKTTNTPSNIAKPIDDHYSRAWPEYQNERPAVSPRFLERCDIPTILQVRSNMWLTEGAGKSQLALKAILENNSKFRGIFYVDASNDTSANTSYLEIARLCGIKVDSQSMTQDEQVRFTRSWLSCRTDPWLLMIDNVTSSDVALAKYVPTVGPGAIIITTTDENLTLWGSLYAKVGCMNAEDSLNLLMRFKREEISLSTEQEDAAKRLAVETLGGCPWQFPKQAHTYSTNVCPSYSQPVWTAFDLTLSRIQDARDPESAQALDLLGTLCFFHHEGIRHSLFEEAWKNLKIVPAWSKGISLLGPTCIQLDSPSLKEAFQFLDRYSLLEASLQDTRNYSLHRLVKIVYRERLSVEEQRKYLRNAISIIAVALSGIKSPLSWINNPEGFELQRSVLPHIKTCTEGRLNDLLQEKASRSQDAELGMLLLFSRAYSSTGNFAEARRILQAVCEALGIPNHCGSMVQLDLHVLEQRAACDTCLGRHALAYDSRRAIVECLEQNGPPSDLEVLNVAKMNLADSLWLTGCRKEASEMAQNVLALREQSLSQSDPRVIRTKRKVAEYLHGTFQRRDALQMRENIQMDANPPRNPTNIEFLDWLSTSNALADSYQWDGQLIKARALRSEVFNGRFKTLGFYNCDTLLAYERLLSIDFRLAQTIKAHRELCHKRWRLAETWEELLGAEHPYTLEARVNLGHSYSATGQWLEAWKEQSKVLQIRERLANEERTASHELSWLSSMGNVANILIKTGDLVGALTLRKKALSESVKLYGMNHPSTFRLSHHIISCYSGPESGIRPSTVIKMRECLLLRQKQHCGEDDPLVLLGMSLLASDNERAGRRVISIDLRRELLVRQKLQLGGTNHDTLDNMKKLARSLHSLQRTDHSWISGKRAARLLEEVSEAEVKFLGANNAQAHNTRIELYRIYRALGDDINAKATAQAIRKTECDYSIGNTDRFIDYAMWEDNDETDDDRKASKQVQKKAKLDRLSGQGYPRRRKRRRATRGTNIFQTSSLAQTDPRRYGPGTLEEVFPAVELDNQDEFGLVFPVIPRRVLTNEELYPSSSEKFGGESGSEASDSSSGFWGSSQH